MFRMLSIPAARCCTRANSSFRTAWPTTRPGLPPSNSRDYWPQCRKPRMNAKRRIAILSPVAWRTPPRHYGAWETVASNIAEGLVSRGWQVTLFATADSITRARLHAVVDRGYEEDSTTDPKVAEYLHISEVFEH